MPVFQIAQPPISYVEEEAIHFTEDAIDAVLRGIDDPEHEGFVRLVVALLKDTYNKQSPEYLEDGDFNYHMELLGLDAEMIKGAILKKWAGSNKPPKKEFMGNRKYIKKGHARGSNIHCSKLSEEQVMFIHQNKDISGYRLGKMLGVRPSTIHKVRSGDTWNHLKPNNNPTPKGSD